MIKINQIKSIIVCFFSLFLLNVKAESKLQSIWNAKIVIQDHVPHKQGTTTSLFGFNASLGEIMLEIDSVSKKVVSFSGVFRDLDKKGFSSLEKILCSRKHRDHGIQQIKIQEVTYDNGYQDKVLMLDLDLLSIELPTDTYSALENSSQIGINLTTNENGSLFGMSVNLEFEDELSKHQIELMDWNAI